MKVSLKRLGIAAALGGAAIAATPALASAASTCTFEPNALPARVNIIDQSGGFEMRVVRSGQFIGVADGSAAPTLCASPSGSFATVTNTDLIRVFGAGTTGGADGYVVDQTKGALAPGKSLEPDGVSEIETSIDTGVATSVLRVRGVQTGPNTMRVASGGGVMIGSDSDVDIRDRNAVFVELDGGPFGDLLSGRGGAPAASPGMSTTVVQIDGEGGGDTLVDGPLSGDMLLGSFGNDTLFTQDFKSGDFAFGNDGFDEATLDIGDKAFSDTEKTNLPFLGRMKLTPARIEARAGRPTRVSLGWRHPKSWKQVRTLKLVASDGGEKVGAVTIDPAQGRVSGHGALRIVRGASTVSHRGKTVTGKLTVRVSRRLAGRTLNVSVRATDVRGHTQNEPLAGTLRVAK